MTGHKLCRARPPISCPAGRLCLPAPLRTCFDSRVMKVDFGCRSRHGHDASGKVMVLTEQDTVRPGTVSPSPLPRSARSRGGSRNDGESGTRHGTNAVYPLPCSAVFLNSLRRAVYSPIQRRKNFVAISLSITTSLLCGLPIAPVSVSEAVLCPLLSPRHPFECHFFFPLVRSDVSEKNKAFFQCPA